MLGPLSVPPLELVLHSIADLHLSPAVPSHWHRRRRWCHGRHLDDRLAGMTQDWPKNTSYSRCCYITIKRAKLWNITYSSKKRCCCCCCCWWRCVLSIFWWPVLSTQSQSSRHIIHLQTVRTCNAVVAGRLGWGLISWCWDTGCWKKTLLKSQNLKLNGIPRIVG